MLQKKQHKGEERVEMGKGKSEGVDESEQRCEFMHTHM